MPETRSIPVVMLSVVENRAFGVALGAFDYLVKPIERSVLFATLARAGVLATGGYILVVDDEMDLRKLLEQELVAAGYAVRTVAGGAQALDLMDREPPTAVLLDLMMPSPDGFEVLYRMRADPALKQVKVIIVTARDLSASDEQMLSGSVKRIIRKGDDPSRLIGEVLRAISADRSGARIA